MTIKVSTRACLIALTTIFLTSCGQSAPPLSQADLEARWQKNQDAGLAAMENGRFTEAETLLKQAADDAEKFGARDPRTAATFNNLASAYEKQKKYDLADQYYQKALSAIEASLGTEHSGVAVIAVNLARMYVSQEKLPEASQLYRRALSIKETALGAKDPTVADLLQELADLYFKQGKYALAEPLYERAIFIRVPALGQSAPQVVLSLDGYAKSLRKLARNSEAEKIEAIAKSIRAKNSAK